MNPWLSLLKDLDLTRPQREVVERFAANPNGLGFLPVVEVLRDHHLADEAIELLTWGVERHPHYPAARALLAKDLYQRGMISEAWEKLHVTHVSLSDNILAQQLLFKCALLLGYESSARGFLHHMKRQQMLDRPTRSLGNTFEIEGLGKARAQLISEFKGLDITPLLPKTSADEQRWAANPSPLDLRAPTLAPELTLSSDFLADHRLGQFHVVPLSEIFQPTDGEDEGLQEPGGVELDTPTLADIYAKQGHFSKSLAIYRRLLKLSPNNEYLRKVVSDLARKEQSQKENDLTVDPRLVDKMEAIELIDSKIRFYTNLLDRLSHTHDQHKPF